MVIAAAMTRKSFNGRPVFLQQTDGQFRFEWQEGGPEVQQAIEKGDCLICRDVPYRMNDQPLFDGAVLIVGTTNEQSGRAFKRDYFLGAAALAAGGVLTKEDPVSVLPVFYVKRESRGDRVNWLGELHDKAVWDQIARSGGVAVKAVDSFGRYPNRLCSNRDTPMGAIVVTDHEYSQRELDRIMKIAGSNVGFFVAATQQRYEFQPCTD